MSNILFCPSCRKRLKGPALLSDFSCEFCSLSFTLTAKGTNYFPERISSRAGLDPQDIQNRLDFFAESWARGVPEKVTFRKYKIINAVIENTCFSGMLAEGSQWARCRFSRCDFTAMVLKNTVFEYCQFIDCTRPPVNGTDGAVCIENKYLDKRQMGV